MTRYVIALFSRAFPQPFPETWRLVWREKISRWMVWLAGTFLFALPFIQVSAWMDSLELPKSLFGLGIMTAWIFLGLVRSFLLPNASIRLPRFISWIVAFVVLGTVSIIASPHPALSWLGNGWQSSSSVLVAVLALWLIVALWDGVRHVPSVERFFVRAWVAGTLIAALLGLSVTRTLGNPFDLATLSPLILLAGVYLLNQVPSITHPIDRVTIQLYRFSHALLAIALCALFGILTLLDIGLIWMLLGVVAVLALGGMIWQKRRITLSIVVVLFVALCSVGSLVSWRNGMPATWMNAPRQALGFVSVSEVLPNYALTWQVVKTSLEQKPLLGVGPGGWIYAFDQARPLSLNQTPLWNARLPRAASALFTWAMEYGILGSLLGFLFFCATFASAIRMIRQTKSQTVIWASAFFFVAFVLSAMRPFGITQVIAMAFGIGLIWAAAPSTNDLSIPQSFMKQSRTWIAIVGFLIVCLGVGYDIRRAVAAILLTTPTTSRITVAMQLNPADDVMPDRLAQTYLELASGQFASSSTSALNLLTQADDALAIALARNPVDAEHWSLAVRLAQARAGVSSASEQAVLQAAQQLNVLRPTDPFAPLALFSVYRAQAARETRWVEQGQGLEKEQALERQGEAQAKAEQALAEALRRKADYAPALYAQSAWFAQRGKTNEAIIQLQQLVNRSPLTPELSLPLALLYREAQQPDRAIALLIPLIEQYPTVLDYQWQLVLTTVQAKYWDQSIVILQRLIAADPQNLQYREFLKEVIQRRAKLTAPAVVQPILTIATSTEPVASTSFAKKRSTTKTRVK